MLRRGDLSKDIQPISQCMPYASEHPRRLHAVDLATRLRGRLRGSARHERRNEKPWGGQYHPITDQRMWGSVSASDDLRQAAELLRRRMPEKKASTLAPDQRPTGTRRQPSKNFLSTQTAFDVPPTTSRPRATHQLNQSRQAFSVAPQPNAKQVFCGHSPQ